MWQANFYQQYMQQHAAMTQWIMQLHANIHHPHPTYSHQVQHANPHCFQSTNYQQSYPTPQAYCHSSATVSDATNVTDTDVTIEEEEYYENSEYDDNESCEYELNVEAILAMRAAKKELDKASAEEIKSSKSSVKDSCESESYVLIDSEKEEFELIELGSIRTLDSKFIHPVGMQRNLGEEMQLENKVLEHIYGEKSENITSLEAIEINNFNDMFDLLQPPLWPVIPVRL